MDGFGIDFGKFWTSFAHSRAPVGVFSEPQNRTFIKHWSNMGSKRPFGSILGRFGQVWGVFWKGLGRDFRDLGGFWAGLGLIFGSVWTDLALLGQIL